METKRIVDINTYWATIVKDTAQFGQIAVAENPEFNRLSECIFRALKDSFIHSATEYGVKRWESMLQIAPSAGETLEERKARILTYLNLKLPYTWRVLKQLIEGIVGEGNVELNLDNDTQTLTIEVPDTHIETVKDLVSRVIPMNLDIQYWIDGVPSDYTLLEYLESSGTQVIKTGHIPTINTGFKCKVQETTTRSSEAFYCGSQTSTFGIWVANRRYNGFRLCVQVGHSQLGIINIEDAQADMNVVEAECNFYNSGKAGRLGQQSKVNMDGEWSGQFTLFKATYKRDGNYDPTRPIRIFYFALTEGDELMRDFIPVLDSKGVPCLYDRVTKTPYYNSGTGTFGYALKESTVQASGVYARLINGELEVVADTEDPTSAAMPTDLDDDVTAFVHFNNVGEAMEHYNIEPEKLTKIEGIEQ